MPPVEFEPTTRVFERTKTVHALDRAAIVSGTYIVNTIISSTRTSKETLRLRNKDQPVNAF
jgi:hypothetical protein